MPRKGFVSRRTVQPDAVYSSDLVQKFINSMMWDGKRSTAQRIFYGAMEQIGQKANDEPLKLFKKAVENVKPVLEVKSRRVGGANYQVPVEVSQFRQAVAGDSLAAAARAHASGQAHDGQAGGRIAGCGEWPGRRDEEEGRRAPHGGSEQGFRALSLVRIAGNRR